MTPLFGQSNVKNGCLSNAHQSDLLLGLLVGTPPYNKDTLIHNSIF
jgi:hypothetical protein